MKQKNKSKLIIVSAGLLVVVCFGTYVLSRLNIIEYLFQRTLMANNPTVLFSCDKFGSEASLNKMLKDNKNEKIIELKKYLSENNGNLFVETVGDRCPSKYQFVASFGGDNQRIEIEQILKDQTIDGIPVFLLNQ